jgi:hypothetical protein
LPIELRLDIWGIAASESRVIEITFNRSAGEKRIPGAKKIKTGLQAKTETPIPAILHACRESRNVATKVYEKLVIGKGYAGVLVSWEHDIIYISTGKCMHKVMALKEMNCGASHFSKRCQRLAIESETPKYKDTLCGTFPKMKEYILVEELDIQSRKRLLLKFDRHEWDYHDEHLAGLASDHQQIQRTAIVWANRALGPMTKAEKAIKERAKSKMRTN